MSEPGPHIADRLVVVVWLKTSKAAISSFEIIVEVGSKIELSLSVSEMDPVQSTKLCFALAIREISTESSLRHSN